jgi:hypothetical protein
MQKGFLVKNPSQGFSRKPFRVFQKTVKMVFHSYEKPSGFHKNTFMGSKYY